MPRFRVRFKGMLTKDERERLDAAGISLESSEPGTIGGIPGAGRPTYCVSVEAESPEDGLAKVREALEPDTGNFTDWDSSR
ncbi:MAG TPA: hypothetical protein VFY75_05785 [Solirubrobacterales bacterium]|nr:hypothetical protein [Solirubrobacterales bacterium]